MRIVALTLILSLFSTDKQISDRPYYSPLIDLNDPFYYKKQLQLFATNKVKTVTYKSDNDHYTSYYFHRDGKIQCDSTWYSSIYNERSFVSSGKYTYNKKGLLIKYEYSSPTENNCYEIKYDNIGRMVFYDEIFTFPDEFETWVDTLYALRFMESDSSSVLLSQNLGGMRFYYQLNNENRIVKSWDELGQTKDSLFIERGESGKIREYHYHREADSLNYTIGMTVDLMDGLIQSSRTYYITNPDQVFRESNYYYNDENLLVKILTSSDRPRAVIYKYNDRGLISKVIRSTLDRVTEIDRTYEYWE